jgi:hypothetical protein
VNVAAMMANPTRAAIAAGVMLGLIYTLSPLSLVAIAGGGVAVWWAARPMGPDERRWFLWIVGIAVALRLALIAGLFLSADPARPFSTFFGDEELFKSRPIWIRNLGLGVPISAADWIYAFDDTGKSGYLFVLAAIQAFLGDAPYAVHVLNAAIYLCGALLLHRLARASFGKTPAMFGLIVLMLFPSLFAWSISALKEPMYTCVAAIEILIVMQIVRAPGVLRKAAAVVALVIAADMLESLRKGGMQVAALGAAAGIVAGSIVPRPRLLLASAIAAPMVLVVLLNVAPVQARVLTVVRDAVRYHAGHILTVGQTYQMVDPLYYYDWPAIFAIGPRESVQYVARSVVHYVVEPLPWVERSRAMLFYVPEQAAWWAMLIVLPFGIAAGLKADALLTATLLSHAAAIGMMVALTSGNVGTLIRHRGLIFPYLVWLVALGGCRLLEWFAGHTRLVRDGDPDGTR